jgi:hypothetical protein
MLLPLGSRTSAIWPIPVKSPAPSNAARCRQAPAPVAASRIFASVEGQTNACTIDNTELRSAALTPAPIPVRITAIQNRAAPGLRNVGGIIARELAASVEGGSSGGGICGSTLGGEPSLAIAGDYANAGGLQRFASRLPEVLGRGRYF